MRDVVKFDTWRQRAFLTRFADEGCNALKTAEGMAFIEQLHEFFAPSMVGIAMSWGYHCENDDVVNMIIERLLSTLSETERCPVRYAATSEDPWAYLWACTVRWGHEMRGTRGVALEHAEFLPSPAPDEVSMTPLEDVVDLTFAVVAQVTEAKYHAPVRNLLGWLAANPPQRLSYELDDRIAAHRHCPELSIEQVIAVMKIARGSRPNVEETSLMGQFLLDDQFQVSRSCSHMRAVTHFKNRFRAGVNGSRDLRDWVA
ncbi:hypothetical protein [Leucobacter musarum]|uniref:hypothetical protein n=1 Tax=Leucobacter musarum TaxID=1930747 RepID=UPI0006A7AB09|nr:hypothetical protein [Leucobacter musarum]